jgi:hypothetical protein
MDDCTGNPGDLGCKNCDGFNPFNCTASEAFAKAETGDMVEHKSGSKWLVNMDNVASLKMNLIGAYEYRVIKKKMKTVTVKVDLPRIYSIESYPSGNNTVVYYKGKINLPNAATNIHLINETIEYDVPDDE